MTDLDIINLFEVHHPKSKEEMIGLGLNPIECGSGCARRVYKLSDGLAVKLPHNEHCIRQSQTEIVVLEKIHTNPVHEPIRHLVAPLYYGNRETGTVLTKFYPGKVDGSEEGKIRPIISKLNSLGLYDLFDLNFRKDECGNYIAVDLGHASPEQWIDTP